MRALAKNLSLLFLVVGLHSVSAEEHTLDLQTAIARTLSSSTALKIAQLEIDVKNAEMWQDSLYPNPSVTVEIDGFGGRCENRGFNSAEFSYSISQLILLGGKREARQHLDAAAGTAVRWDYEIALQDAILELTHAFIDAYAAQEKLHLAHRQLKVANESQDCILEKVKNGKATPLQEKKGALTVRTCKVEADKAESAFRSAKQKLAGLWEEGQADFDALVFPFDQIAPVPPLATYEEMLPYSPEFYKANAVVEAAFAEKRFEEVQWIPDVEVSAGMGTPRDFSDQDFFVSVSFPLPIFDRNQGNVCRASVQLTQALLVRQNLEILQRKNLAAAYRDWVIAFEHAKASLELAEAYAHENLQSNEESFKQGKVERQEWLDAQKDLLDAHGDMLDALAEYHNKKAETLRAAGALLPYCTTLNEEK